MPATLEEVMAAAWVFEELGADSLYMTPMLRVLLSCIGREN